MKRPCARVLAAGVALGAIAGCHPPARPATAPDLPALQRQVRATEAAFARTMADRDHGAFCSFLSDEARFFSKKGVLRGKAAVCDGWKRFFAPGGAPFAWAPEQVEVLESGDLALSSGPVLTPDGKRVATFTSIWRLGADGCWRIVFDKGCDCP